MITRRFLAVTMFVLLLGIGAGATAHADSSSNSSAKQMGRYMPVLVKVNANGKITHMDPAYDVTPRTKRTLHKTLEKMITKPAHDKDGKPISSESVITLKLQPVQRSDGKANVHISYVKIQKVPIDNWHWNYLASKHKLTLVGPHGATRTFGQTQKLNQSRAMLEYQIRQAAAAQRQQSGRQ